MAHDSASPGPVSDGLLHGVRVVDLTDAYGALSTRLLAELGAEVVRIEDPHRSGGRRRAPLAGDGTSLHHVHRNAGKAIVALDGHDPAAHRKVDGLLAGAHVCVVAGGWAASASGAPFDAEALAGRHRHLVVVAVSSFGRTGPAAGWTSSELVDQALAGVVYRAGVAHLPPVAAPGSYCEDVGAVVAAVAGLVGLWGSSARGGAGECFDVSTVLALAQCTDMALPLWSQLGMDQVRSGAGLYPLFPCTDGLARIVLPMSPGEWRALIAWLGSPPEWTGPAWEQPMLGVAEREQVLAALPAQFATRTREAVTADAEAAGVRVTPVLTPAEVLASEHAAARGTFTPSDVAGGTGQLFAGFLSVHGQRAVVGVPSSTVELPPWPHRATPADPSGAGPLPLAGLRVLEIGTGVAAPEAGRVLGEWGAEVIKVESRRRPDFQRRVLGSDMNPAFATPNRNKLLFAADLAHPDGLRLVRSLLPHVDVVIENNATGVLDRLGLGWEVLQEANPRLSLVGTQLYGDRGPWAARKGYGPSARAVGGLAWLWAHGPDAPRGVQTIHPDHLAGRLVALGALSALLHRERTGRGVRVDLAQFEAVTGLLGDLLLAESLTPGAAVPVGNTHPEHVPWGMYRAADDDRGAESWLAISVIDDAQWAALVAAAAGAIADDQRWRTEQGRRANRAAVDEAVADWVRSNDAGALEAALQGAGVAAGRALHPRLQATHPHFVDRGFVVAVDQPGNGPIVLEGAAMVGSRSGVARCGPAPLPGQHTRELCQRLLGLDDTAIDALVATGAIEEA